MAGTKIYWCLKVKADAGKISSSKRMGLRFSFSAREDSPLGIEATDSLG